MAVIYLQQNNPHSNTNITYFIRNRILQPIEKMTLLIVYNSTNKHTNN